MGGKGSGRGPADLTWDPRLDLVRMLLAAGWSKNRVRQECAWTYRKYEEVQKRYAMIHLLEKRLERFGEFTYQWMLALNLDVFARRLAGMPDIRAHRQHWNFKIQSPTKIRAAQRAYQAALQMPGARPGRDLADYVTCQELVPELVDAKALQVLFAWQRILLGERERLPVRLQDADLQD